MVSKGLIMIKYLIVEDDRELLRTVLSYFDSFGYVSDYARDFSTGMEKITQEEYDCIILDINIPGGSGLTLLEELKKKKRKTGVIILSANSSLEDKIDGLDLGADDYLTKPFELPELNARIKSIVRRKVFDGDHKINCNEIEIDLNGQEVKIHNQILQLTKKEFELLLFLINNKNKVITKQSISKHIWGDYIDQTASFDYIYTHLKNLRKKMLALGAHDYIKTIYGIGYKFSVSEYE